VLINIIICMWLLCSILVLGFEFAYWQRNWPLEAKEDYYSGMLLPCIMSVAGPVGLLAVIIKKEYKHGLKFW